MTPWTTRTIEERSHLNPAFCSLLLWHAAEGHAEVAERSLSFEESFLVLPLVLQRDTRASLPRTRRTSLASWLDDNPLARGRLARSSRLLVAHTREALLFGSIHGLIRIVDGRVAANRLWRRQVRRIISGGSEEMRDCTKRSEFVGKWMASAGSASTVLALVGVRP